MQLLHAGILKVLLKLYSPVRRADYISVTGSTLFPFSFCATRSYIALYVVQIILLSQEVRYFHSRFVLQGG